MADCGAAEGLRICWSDGFAECHRVRAVSHAMGFRRDRYRCIVPGLPFGAHTTPMPDDADLSPSALATLIAEFLTELDLHQVTLVCNDWGGAQLVMAAPAAPIVSPTWSWSPVRPSTTTRPRWRAGCCAATQRCPAAPS